MFNGSLNSLNQRTRFTKWFETGSNRVLMYHSIGGGLYDNIPPTQLYRQLKQLDSAFEIVDLPAIADDTTSEKKIALTFDDGFSDFYTQALPVLEDLGVPATVFVMERTFEDPAFVHDPGHDYDYMSEKQVSEVAQHELVSIGNHTMTHPDLTELETHELEEEISDTNNRLEDRFDVTINRFAYPI